MKMDLASALRLFGRIVETGSLSSAARGLGLAQPAASKLLRRLETQCGARLFERSPLGMAPTAAGRRLYHASNTAVAAIDGAIEAIREDGHEIAGRIRVHSPGCLGERHLNRIAAAFRERHPSVAIDLMLGNDGVDLAAEEVDLAFGLRPPKDPAAIDRRIGVARRALVASPAYLARRGAPRRPEELERHDLAVTDASLSADGALRLEGPEGALEIALEPALRTNSVGVLREALLGGRAIGTAQVLLVCDELADGRLARVLPDWRIAPSDIRLSYRSARLMRPAVRAFMEFAVPEIRAIEGVDLR